MKQQRKAVRRQERPLTGAVVMRATVAPAATARSEFTASEAVEPDPDLHAPAADRRLSAPLRVPL